VTTPPSWWPGSGTRTKRWRFASASIRSRVAGLPVGTLATLPWRRDDAVVYGPGIVDMKGGNLIALEVAARMRKPRPHAVAEPHPPGNDLHRCPRHREVAGGERHHYWPRVADPFAEAP
jgi:hypothetical protein